MELPVCLACGHALSKDAPACPECGYPVGQNGSPANNARHQVDGQQMTASNAAASAAASPRDSWLARSPTWVLFLLVFAGGAAVLAAVITATVVLGSAIVSEFENTADPGDAAEAVTAVSTDAT
jgi:hypothetical protein